MDLIPITYEHRFVLEPDTPQEFLITTPFAGYLHSYFMQYALASPPILDIAQFSPSGLNHLFADATGVGTGWVLPRHPTYRALNGLDGPRRLKYSLETDGADQLDVGGMAAFWPGIIRVDLQSQSAGQYEFAVCLLYSVPSSVMVDAFMSNASPQEQAGMQAKLNELARRVAGFPV